MRRLLQVATVQILFIGQSYFFSDEGQLYLIFETPYYNFKRLGDTKKVISWKFKDSSTEKFATCTTTDNSLSLSIKWGKDSNFCLIFKGSCLKQKTGTFTPPNRINFVIGYKLDTWLKDLNFNFTLNDCLSGGAKLAKNADPDKCVYSGSGIGFDSRPKFSLSDGSVGKNVIIFGVEKTSAVHIDNKNKDL